MQHVIDSITSDSVISTLVTECTYRWHRYMHWILENTLWLNLLAMHPLQNIPAAQRYVNFLFLCRKRQKRYRAMKGGPSRQSITTRSCHLPTAVSRVTKNEKTNRIEKLAIKQQCNLYSDRFSAKIMLRVARLWYKFFPCLILTIRSWMSHELLIPYRVDQKLWIDSLI